jgi:hypothetical protein
MKIRTKLFTSSLTILVLTISGVYSSYSAEKSPEFKAALAQTTTMKDDFTDTTYYKDKSSGKWKNEARKNAFFIYVGTKKGQSPIAVLFLQHYGGDYLFIKKVLFNVDGKTFQLTPSSGELWSETGQVNAFETFDRTMTSTEISLVQWIINSKKTVIRIQGTKNYKDVTITSTQKKSLTRMLTLYKGFGGK